MPIRRLKKRTRMKSLSVNVESTSLKRMDRMRSNTNINVSKQEFQDLLETDQFDDIELTEKETTDLKQGGWTIVTSSNVKAIQATGKSLLIRFGSGSIYEWGNGSNHFTGLLNASSKGRYVHKHLYDKHIRRIR